MRTTRRFSRSQISATKHLVKIRERAHCRGRIVCCDLEVQNGETVAAVAALKELEVFQISERADQLWKKNVDGENRRGAV